MISLKLWNSLSDNTRRNIVKCVHVNNEAVVEDYCKEYHHNFDYDAHGRHLKAILSCCNLQKDNSINITINIKPYYQTKTTGSNSATIKPKKKSIPKKKVKEDSGLKRYYCRRYTTEEEDDGENVWTDAYSEQEAIKYFHQEYWNTKKVIVMKVENINK